MTKWLKDTWRGGLVHLNLQVNFRWPLGIYCWWHWTHEMQHVQSVSAWARSYSYCKRCGKGWRDGGKKKCWLPRQHQWGTPPWVLGPSTKDGKPFREIQECARCRQTRAIECETREVVAR